MKYINEISNETIQINTDSCKQMAYINMILYTHTQRPGLI